jgi:hypothetical protein
MQYGKMLGVIAGMLLGGVSHGVTAGMLPMSMARLRPMDGFNYTQGGGGARGARIERHTGARGRGAHRHWKALRASGRA